MKTELKVPTEFEEQMNFVTVAKLKFPGIMICSQIAGANLGKAASGRAKAAGYMKGWPDIFIAEPVVFDDKGKTFFGLFIEMKRRDKRKSVVSADQKKVLKDLSDKGYKCVVCYGWEDAMTILEIYMNGPHMHRGVMF